MDMTRNPYEVSVLSMNLTPTVSENEEIVVDERDTYSPADFIQQKLQRLLPAASIPVSCLHTGRSVRRYPS